MFVHPLTSFASYLEASNSHIVKKIKRNNKIRKINKSKGTMFLVLFSLSDAFKELFSLEIRILHKQLYIWSISQVCRCPRELKQAA